MPNSLEKIIELIKKTGDNCIVLDKDGSPAYVIVSFSDYQKIVLGKSEVAGLTENELLSKINRDIAAWKGTQEAENLDNWQEIESAIEGVKKISSRPTEEEKSLNQANNDQDSKDSDEKYYFEPID
jgi:hypothetical protein